MILTDVIWCNCNHCNLLRYCNTNTITYTITYKLLCLFIVVIHQYTISIYHWHFFCHSSSWVQKNYPSDLTEIPRHLTDLRGADAVWDGLSHWVSGCTMDMMGMACLNSTLKFTKDLEGGMNQRCAYRILQDLTGTKGSKHILSQSLDTLCTGTQRKCQIVQHHIQNMSWSRARQKSAVLTLCFFQLHVDTTECVLSDWIRLNLLWKVWNSQLGEFIQDLVVRLQQRFRTLARRACKVVTYCRGHVFYHEKHS